MFTGQWMRRVFVTIMGASCRSGAGYRYQYCTNLLKSASIWQGYALGHSGTFRLIINNYGTVSAPCFVITGRSSRVAVASDCGVRGPWFASHRGRLCLSRQLLRYTALGTGCAPLLQCPGRLALPSYEGRENEHQFTGGIIIAMTMVYVDSS